MDCVVLHPDSGIHIPRRTSSEASRHAGRGRGADAVFSRRSDSAGGPGAEFQTRTPALFLVSSQSPGRWSETSTDPKIKEQIAGLSAFTERQAKAIEDGLPSARVVRLSGANHYVFLSHEADVVREIRSFLERVP